MASSSGWGGWPDGLELALRLARSVRFDAEHFLSSTEEVASLLRESDGNSECKQARCGLSSHVSQTLAHLVGSRGSMNKSVIRLRNEEAVIEGTLRRRTTRGSGLSTAPP